MGNYVDELISFHGGISQQDISLRLPQQVEDSINCYHSLEYGTRRRNPTEAIGSTSGVNSQCWSYEYDRGLSGSSNEKYSILYDENGFRVIDMTTGNNVNVEDNSGTYMQPFTSKTGYSAITVKDTTFITNRNKYCLSNTIVGDYNTEYDICSITSNQYKISRNGVSSSTVPRNISVSIEMYLYGNKYTFDSTINLELSDYTVIGPVIFNSGNYECDITSRLNGVLDDAIKVILESRVTDFYYYGNNSFLYHDSNLSSNLSVSMTIVEDAETTNVTTPSTSFGTATLTPNMTPVDYNNAIYLWIKRSDPVDGYTYNVDINGTVVTSTGMLTTEEVASDLATQLSALSGITAEYNGNIVKVVTTFDISLVSVNDDYGNLAIGYFWKNVTTEDSLPNVMPYDGVLIKVGGKNNYDAEYWLTTVEGKWVETVAPESTISIDNTTMPHKITRQYDANGVIKFVIEPIYWNNRLVGDDENSKVPSFINSCIVDLFFHANRFGFLTPNSVVMSEVGEFYNFWKTTQVAVLDSDRIDIEVESNKAIKLHYIDFLKNDMIIFGERNQYKLEYNGILSSATLYATQISSYEISTSCRPLSIGDKIYFTTYSEPYNSLYVMKYNSDETISKAECVSKQVPQLVYGAVDELVGSASDSIIFIKSKLDSNTIYVYKYLENDNKLVQSSWFKWTFNAEIYSIFVSNSNLYMLVTRDGVVGDNRWLLSSGVFDDSLKWIDEETWNDTSSVTYNNVEKIKLTPIDINDSFLDNGETEYVSEFTLSEYLPRTRYNIRLSDKINLKTIYIKSDSDSKFELDIIHKNRDLTRTIDSKYVIGKKPYIMGKAKDVAISVKSVDDYGFEVNGVAIEARINNRSRSI